MYATFKYAAAHIRPVKQSSTMYATFHYAAAHIRLVEQGSAMYATFKYASLWPQFSPLPASSYFSLLSKEFRDQASKVLLLSGQELRS